MNIFDNNVSLYFFSAVLQANTALIAFAAVFAVFRFQLILQWLQSKDAEIIQAIHDFFARHPMQPPEELRSHYSHIGTLQQAIKDLLADPNYKPSYRSWIDALVKDEVLARLFSERTGFATRQANLKKRFRWPMLSLLFVIILALCLLPFSTYIHSSFPNCEFIPIFVTVLLNIWALLLNARFVFVAIKD